MNYKQMPHQFIRFEDSIINVDHIIEIFDDLGTPNHITIMMNQGTSITIPGNVKDFAEACGLDFLEYKAKVYTR